MTREEVKSLFALLLWKVKFVHSRSGLSVLLAILLSGCGTNLDTTQSTERIQNQESTSVGTNGQLISIQSDNVRAAGYDASVLVMTVQFNSGYVYEYYGVQPDLWNSFIAAQPNPWSQVGYPRLVQAMVPYKRIR
jgi:hypothetical protein